jgi:hypothetical protein
MNSKFLLAALAAFAAAFLGGWLIWGMALTDFYTENTAYDEADLNRETPLYWAYAVGSLLTSLLLTYVLHSANRNTVSKGFVMGLIFGLLNGLGHAMFVYGGMDVMEESVIAVDALVSAVFTGIIGAIIGGILGSGKKAAAPAM